MALLSPGDVFHRLVQRLPAGPAGVLWNVTYVFAWVTLPYSVYGAIRDLAFVLHYATILGSRLPEMLLGAARWILTQVDATLALWRSITGPIREWLATQPIPFAEQLADIAVVPLLLLPSLVRYVLHRGIYLAEDVAARVTRSEAELAARRAAEAAAARADAQSDNVSGGIASGVAVGAVVGGPVGAVIGVLSAPSRVRWLLTMLTAISRVRRPPPRPRSAPGARLWRAGGTANRAQS